MFNSRNYDITDATVKLDFTGTSAKTAAALATNGVLLIATADCFIAFGADPTATSGSFYLPAKVPIPVSIDPTHKVAAIQSTGAGSVYITPLA